MNPVVIFDLDDSLFDTTGQLDSTYKNLPNITAFPDTHELLRLKGYTKVLLTKGDRDIQHEKLRVLGIGSLFDEIIICGADEEKEAHMKQIIEKYRKKPSEVIVYGDKKHSEIRYGNKLGCFTVCIYHGKHKDIHPSEECEKPKLVIYAVNELEEIIKCLITD